MLQRTILIAVLIVMTIGTSTVTALMIGTRPAWNGWVRADRPTELEIRVMSDHGGLLALTLTDQSISYTHQVYLEPGVEFDWRLPLSPPSGIPLQLIAQIDEEPPIEKQIPLQRHLAPGPLVAVLADQAVSLDGIQATGIHLAGDSLPFYHSSFAAVDLLVIHRDSLRGLARQQLSALRQYAASCGRIVILGFTPEAIAGFRDLAGCGGRFLATAETETDLGTRVTNLLRSPGPQAPSPAILQSLLKKDAVQAQIRPLAVFFTLYLCVLLMALRSKHAAFYFVGTSIVSTLIGLIAWTMSAETVDRVVWSEVNSHDDAARYTSIIRVSGDGNRVNIDNPDKAAPLQPLQAVNRMQVSSQDGSDIVKVSFDTLLFTSHELMTSGVTAMPFKLTLDYVDDRPRVSNTGADTLPPALLVWNGLKYPVPALSANATWLPSGQPEPWGSSEAERIFRQRAMRDVSAILFEDPQIRQHNNGTVHNYLMVRP